MAEWERSMRGDSGRTTAPARQESPLRPPISSFRGGAPWPPWPPSLAARPRGRAHWQVWVTVIAVAGPAFPVAHSKMPCRSRRPARLSASGLPRPATNSRPVEPCVGNTPHISHNLPFWPCGTCSVACASINLAIPRSTRFCLTLCLGLDDAPALRIFTYIPTRLLFSDIENPNSSPPAFQTLPHSSLPETFPAVFQRSLPPLPPPVEYREHPTRQAARSLTPAARPPARPPTRS